jgi:hypothetical protein
MKTRLSVMLLTGCMLATTALAADATLHVLKKQGDGVALEALRIPPGQTQVIPCGGDSDYIDVISPPGPGGSGSLAQRSAPRKVIARNVDGALQLMSEMTGKRRRLPSLASGNGYEIRVCVTAADGAQSAFLITSDGAVLRDKVGPVIDMFAGKIPMQPGDYIICTDTYRVRFPEHVYGTTPLLYDRYPFAEARLPGGTTGLFIVDLGAGQTVVAREFVPEGVSIEDVHMLQYSASGKQMLKYAPGGATGTVQTVIGQAVLPELCFDGLSFTDASVVVLNEFPRFAEREIAGILGIDFLRRAEILSMRLPAGGGPGGSLTLAKEANLDGDVETIPFAMVHTHLMIPTRANGVPVAMIIDTGAPETFLDEQAANAAGVQADGERKTASGLDQGSVEMRNARLKELTIGKSVWRDVPAHVSAMPVFAPMRVHGQNVGLLGNSVLAGYERVDFDFRERTARFVP